MPRLPGRVATRVVQKCSAPTAELQRTMILAPQYKLWYQQVIVGTAEM
jgi:hypothetical protein